MAGAAQRGAVEHRHQPVFRGLRPAGHRRAGGGADRQHGHSAVVRLYPRPQQRLRYFHRAPCGTGRPGGRHRLQLPFCPPAALYRPADGAHHHCRPPAVSVSVPGVRRDAGPGQDAAHPPGAAADSARGQHGPGGGHLPRRRRHPVRLSAGHRNRLAGGGAPGLSGGVSGRAAVVRVPADLLR